MVNPVCQAVCISVGQKSGATLWEDLPWWKEEACLVPVWSGGRAGPGQPGKQQSGLVGVSNSVNEK